MAGMQSCKDYQQMSHHDHRSVWWDSPVINTAANVSNQVWPICDICSLSKIFVWFLDSSACKRIDKHCQLNPLQPGHCCWPVALSTGTQYGSITVINHSLYPMFARTLSMATSWLYYHLMVCKRLQTCFTKLCPVVFQKLTNSERYNPLILKMHSHKFLKWALMFIPLMAK